MSTLLRFQCSKVKTDHIPNRESTVRPRRELKFRIIIRIQCTPSIQHLVVPNLPEPTNSTMETLEVLTVRV